MLRLYTDQELLDAVAQHGTAMAAARALGYANSSPISKRLKRMGIEAARGEQAKHPVNQSTAPCLTAAAHRARATIENGCMLVGSDAHIWPGPLTTAFRAFIELNDRLDPDVTCLNGDVFDGARISRFPSIGWERKPLIVEELGAVQAALRQVKARRKVWTLGNHDLRFETYIANHASEMVGVQGVHLKDHFPDWEPCWSLWVNERSPVCVKHRWKGGIGAPRANTVNSGVTMVTGHLHSLNVTRFSDYWGPRWGVDCGTLAAPYTDQFTHYTEDAPLDWCSGGAVLTFKDGRLLWPELFYVIDEAAGLVSFRGEVFSV